MAHISEKLATRVVGVEKDTGRGKSGPHDKPYIDPALLADVMETMRKFAPNGLKAEHASDAAMVSPSPAVGGTAPRAPEAPPKSPPASRGR